MKKRFRSAWCARKYSSLLLSLLMVSALCSYVSAAPQNEWTGNINVFLGEKSLGETDWSPVESQGEASVTVDFRKQHWPINLAIEFSSAEDDYTLAFVGIESKTTELNVGVLKIWDRSPHIRPFVGGGLSFIDGEFSLFGLSDSDSSAGVWFGTGVYWTLGKHFNLGIELKFSSADVKLFGVDADAGGSHIGGLIGYHW